MSRKTTTRQTAGDMMTDSLKDEKSFSGKRQHDKASNLISFPVSSKGTGQKSGKRPIAMVCFDRRELDQLLNVYGFKVGDGEWRDYAVDMLKERAVFSVFQRQGDVPLYQIEKNPKLARKQGAYSITNAAGQVLKRGHELAVLLKYFDRKPKLRSV